MSKSKQNVVNFVDQKMGAKSGLQEAIRKLVVLTNRHKFDYAQLKYIFRVVRDRCDVVVPGKAKKLIELPQKSDLDAFYSVISNPVHSLIFKFLEGTGIRISELVGLEVNRLNFEQNLIFISEGKGQKDRIVVFGDELKEKIRIYLDGKNNRYLFESRRNSKYSTRRIQQLCSQYRTMAKIESALTCHTFRHIFFTRLAENGITQEKRALIAGHSNQKTQEIYTHLGVGGIKDEILSALNKSNKT